MQILTDTWLNSVSDNPNKYTELKINGSGTRQRVEMK